MKELDRPFTYDEKIQNLDMLRENAAKIVTSNDADEILQNLYSALDRLNFLAHSRMMELAMGKALDWDFGFLSDRSMDHSVPCDQEQRSRRDATGSGS